MPTFKRGVLPKLALVMLAIAVGCKSQPPITTPSLELVEQDWLNADQPSADAYPIPEQTLVRDLSAALGSEAGNTPPQAPPTGRPLNAIILSGGGKFGAYSTGVIAGWTATGTRPTFDIATGVSTGAIIAPLVFLGPKYDEALKSYFTLYVREDLFDIKPIRGIRKSDALADPAKLKAIIDRQINDEFVADLAQAHREGRRLFVGTTNLMTHRLTVWDLTALAASCRPDSTDMVRKVIMAASSIPGFLPPVEFDITVNGVCYHELHGDAGNVTQGFIRTANGLPPGSNVYVICAGYLHTPPRTERPGFFGLVSRGVSDSLDALFRADLVNLYSLCAATRSKFHLISMPPTLKTTGGSMSFHLDEALQMYQVGYQMGTSGPAWRVTPPGCQPGEGAIPRTGLHFVTPNCK